MKTLTLLAVAITGLGLTACAEAQTSDKPVATGNPSYSLYSTGRYANSPANSPLRKMSTAQLQQRRLDLYKTVPQGQTRRGHPYFIYHGQPLPQQDEILAIEAELSRRFDAGDKSAALPRAIPGGIHP